MAPVDIAWELVGMRSVARTCRWAYSSERFPRFEFSGGRKDVWIDKVRIVRPQPETLGPFPGPLARLFQRVGRL
jgi:hypothetical protein